MGRACICLLLLLAVPLRQASAASNTPPAQIYFVAIGSQTYRHLPKQGVRQWQPIAAPENSADLVAERLHQVGARFGILVTSDDTHAVTRADMMQAIVDLKRRIRADHASNPIIFFYYIGHGLGDAFSQTLYLAPGDLDLSFVPSQTMTNPLTRLALSNLDVVASLMSFRLPPVMAYLDSFFVSDLTPDFSNWADIEKTVQLAMQLTAKDDQNRAEGLYPSGRIPPVPYIALFDNCYGGVEQDLVDSARAAIGKTLVTTGLPGKMLSVAGDLAKQRLLDQLSDIQSDGLVLYAARPGQAIGDYADPEDRQDLLPVGSLARRLLLTLRRHRHDPRVSLRQFRDDMYHDAAAADDDREPLFAIAPPAPYSVGPPSDETLDDVALNLVGPPSPETIDRRTGSAKVAE